MDRQWLGALLIFALMSATETARIPFGSLIQSNRTFTLLNTPQLPGNIFKLSCLNPNEVATLDSRDMQLHLVTEANRTQYSDVSTWITLDRALTRYDSLFYINGTVVPEDVTKSNSTDLLCVSLYVKEGETTTYQTDACSRQHSFICRSENTTTADGICSSGVCFFLVISNSTWFDARYRCITEYSGDLAIPPPHILNIPSFRDRTIWVAAASEDSMAAYKKWQPGQDTPSYNCVLLSLATGNWTAVSCDQTNDFVLCEKETFNNLATTTSTLVSTTYIEDNELTSTPSATTNQATTPLITTMELTTPPATTMELTKPPATTMELTTPPATTIELTTPPVTTKELTTPSATTSESNTPKISTMESTTPQISTMESTTPQITTMESTTPSVSTAGSTTNSSTMKPLASTLESTTRQIATTESTEHHITTQISTNESSSSSLTTTESTQPSTAESTAESTTEPAADNSTGDVASSEVTIASAVDINITVDPNSATEKTVVITGDDSNLTLIIGVAVACTVVYVIIVVIIAVCCYRRITAKRTRGDRESSTASLAPLDNATPRNVSRNPSFRFTEAAVRTSFDGDAVNRDKYLSLEQSGGFGRVAAPSVMSDFTDLYAVYPKENATAYGEKPTAIDEDSDDEGDSELPDDFMDFSEFADPLYNTVPAHSNIAKPSAPIENIPHYSNTLDASSPTYANLEMRRNGGALRTESFKEGPKGGIYALPMRRPENMQNRDSAMTTIL